MAPQKDIVQKARRRPREYPALNNVADAMAKSVKANLLGDLRSFRRSIDVQDVARALQNKDMDSLLRVIDARNIGDQFVSFETAVREGFIKGAQAAVQFLPTVSNPESVFSASHPRVETFIRGRIGEQIQGITQRSQIAVQDAVIRMFDEGLPPTTGADLIKNIVGLTEQQALAVDNYRRGLIEQEVPRGRIGAMVDAYADDQLDIRAENIARTESQTAVNGGQQELWAQAAEEGLINAEETMKEWIIDPGTACPICFAIAAQGPVPVDAEFETEDGTILTPPAHPRCNCGMALVFNERSLTT